MPLTAPTLGAVTVGDTTATPSGMSHSSVTGIGIGSTVHNKKMEKGYDAAPLGILTGSIGAAQTTQSLKAVSTPDVAIGDNKVTRYMEVGGADVANGAVIATGWVNRSGQTMLAGENAVAVAA